MSFRDDRKYDTTSSGDANNNQASLSFEHHESVTVSTGLDHKSDLSFGHDKYDEDTSGCDIRVYDDNTSDTVSQADDHKSHRDKDLHKMSFGHDKNPSVCRNKKDGKTVSSQTDKGLKEISAVFDDQCGTATPKGRTASLGHDKHKYVVSSGSDSGYNTSSSPHQGLGTSSELPDTGVARSDAVRSASIHDVYQAINLGQKREAEVLLEDYRLIEHINDALGMWC